MNRKHTLTAICILLFAFSVPGRTDTKSGTKKTPKEAEKIQANTQIKKNEKPAPSPPKTADGNQKKPAPPETLKLLLPDKYRTKDFIIPQILFSFMKKFNCKIESYTYSGSSDAIDKIKKQPGFFDIVLLRHSQLENLIKNKLLDKLDKKSLPNLENIKPEFKELIFDRGGNYFVPYLWGSTGLLYRKDIIGHKITSWNEYFKPEEKLHGKLAMPDSPELMIPLAMLDMGYPPYDTNSSTLKQAARMIEKLRDDGFITLIFKPGNLAELKKDLYSGKILMTPLSSNGAAAIVKEKPQLNFDFAIPHEGGEFYIECFAIPAGTKNKNTAYEFINYIISPQIHAAQGVKHNLACPDLKALEIIRKENSGYLLNTIIHPQEDVMNRLWMIKNDSEQIRTLWNEILKTKKP